MAIESASRPKKIKYQRSRGTYDILAEDFLYLNKVLKTCEKQAQFYGFSRIEPPIFENAELFTKGIGQETDVVGRQMYFLKGKKDKILALRPEYTASVIRAYIENGFNALPRPIKLWYFGPCFRHEKPQAGRFRQFWQFGFEILGRQNPVVDLQVIEISLNVLKKLGIKNLIVQINSIGCFRCRNRYIKNLVNFLRPHKNNLCRDCRRRIKGNPLRVLDCKKEKCQKIIAPSLQILDSLCKKCRYHFREVLELLDSLEIPYELNAFLVRGLDYYNRTVFEIFSKTESDKDNSPIALVGGGRYDELVELLGGRSTPACGSAAGVERIIDLIKKGGAEMSATKAPQVFLAQLGSTAKRRALALFEDFKKANILVAEDFSRDSLKNQLAKANRLGVRYVLILGQKEVIDNMIILRDMRKKSQKKIRLNNIIQEVKKKIK